MLMRELINLMVIKSRVVFLKLKMVKSQYATTGIILKTKPVIKQMKSSVPVPHRELLLSGL